MCANNGTMTTHCSFLTEPASCEAVPPNARSSPTNSMASVRLIALADDLSGLQELRSRSYSSDRLWLRFLTTAEPPGDSERWREASARLSSAATDMSAAVSKPLLLLFLCAAERCCQQAVASLSAEQLLTATEASGNVLHALVLGLSARLKQPEAYDSVLSLLLRLLPSEAVRRLNECSGHLDLRPAELAARMGEFRFAERLLMSGVLPAVDRQVRGPNLVTTFELGPYDVMADESRFLQSPLMFLSEYKKIEQLRRLKESKVLRPDSLFHAWINSMFKNCFAFGYIWSFLSLAVSFLSAFVGSSYSRKRIASACGQPLQQPIHWSEAVMEILLISSIILVNLSFGVISIVLPFCFRSPKIPFNLKVFLSCLLCYSSNLICIIGGFIWMGIIAHPQDFCSSDMRIVHSIATAAVSILFLIVAFFSSILTPILGKFLKNFFKIIRCFLTFLFFYLLVIFVFASTFQTVYFNANAGSNATREAQNDQLFKDFPESVYTTFRMSLNIVDLPRASTSWTFRIFHTIYVFILPIMFFNYIIGVVTTSLSILDDVRYEAELIDKAQIIHFINFSSLTFKKLLQQLGFKRTPPTITICIPFSDDLSALKQLNNDVSEESKPKLLEQISMGSHLPVSSYQSDLTRVD